MDKSGEELQLIEDSSTKAATITSLNSKYTEKDLAHMCISLDASESSQLVKDFWGPYNAEQHSKYEIKIRRKIALKSQIQKNY